MTPRILLPAILLLSIALPAAGQEGASRPTKLYASAAEVEQLLAKAKAEHKGDNTNTNEIIANVGPYPVQLEYRTGTTSPSVHIAQAELIYVVDGGCTLITGGTLLGAKTNGGNMSGNGIAGGAAQKLSKGDYVLVPSGTPHWYTDVRGRFVSVTLHMPMAVK